MLKQFRFLTTFLKMIFVMFSFKAEAYEKTLNEQAYQASLTSDFAMRDQLPETAHPAPRKVGKFAWGPRALTYPPVIAPSGVNPTRWKRDRVIQVAEKYIGLPYMHRHIPSQGGLDCSNFTAWVYNYGFGIRFSSDVKKQAQEAGRRLGSWEPLEPGDLLFIWNKGKTQIKHVVIYISPDAIIDSTITRKADGVSIRPFKGWYKERYAWARRIFN